MPTLLSAIRTRVRTELREPVASYWSDAELLDHLVAGVKDLWRTLGPACYQKYKFKQALDVTLAANATQLSTVPADCGVVLGIEPLSLSGRTGPVFRKADYLGADMQMARAQSAQDPSQVGRIFYDVTEEGAPVAAPVILVAPKISATLALRLIYVPTTALLTADSANPIPGESDNALFAWGLAYARAKERDDRSPDPNWLAVYATEKTNIEVALKPRSGDTDGEDDVSAAFFETEW
jgi:hypothetical protein